MTFMVATNVNVVDLLFSTRIIPKPMTLKMKGPTVLMPPRNLNLQQTKQVKKDSLC